MNELVDVPRVPLGEWFNDGFEWLTDNLAAFFEAIETTFQGAIDALGWLLDAPAPLLMALIFTALGLVARGWKFALVTFLGLLLIISIDQWDAAMQTLTLVLVATVVAVVLAVPIGVLAARSNRVSVLVRPALDLMQTMPAFVWLVPVVTLFGIGFVPGVVATIIFALPQACASPSWASVRSMPRSSRPGTPSAGLRARSSARSSSRWRCPRSWQGSTRSSCSRSRWR